MLFGNDSDPWPHQPDLDAETAGILLEVMRDLLYQTFVRKERLLQAMTFRRFVSPAPSFAPAPSYSAADVSPARQPALGIMAPRGRAGFKD